MKLHSALTARANWRTNPTRMLAALLVVLTVLLCGWLGQAQAKPPEAPALQPGQPEAIPPAPAAAASPTSTQFTQTYVPTKDTYIRFQSMNSNFGGASSLLVERSGSAPLYYNTFSLIGFDLSDLPANAVIDDAVLQIYSEINQLEGPAAPAALTIVPDAILGSWEEMTITWYTFSGQTNQGDTGGVYSSGWHNINVYHIVNSWQTGALANNGIGLRLATGQAGSALFHSRDSGTTAFPRLTITFHTEGSPALLPVQEDTFIFEGSQASNYGGLSYIRVAGGTFKSYSLLKFDLSSLPANIEVNSARLHLYSEINLSGTGEQAAPQAPNDIYPYLVTSPWSEMSVTWNSNVQALSRGDPGKAYTIGWMDLDVTQTASSWASGAYLNNGIQLRLGEGGNQVYYFFTRSGQKLARLEIAYTEAPPPCTAITQVNLSGPAAGQTNTAYTFSAGILPAGATPPVSYSFSATDQSPILGSSASEIYSWSTPGTKTVTVQAENCGGAQSTSRQIVISEPEPECPFPLTGAAISGPAEGLVETEYTFSSQISPANATLPITYAWQASGQSAASNSQASYTWPAAGEQTLTLTASNCGGSFVAYHAFQALLPTDLPDLRVSSAWFEPDQARIGFLVHNQGGRQAPAGFRVEAFRNGETLNFRTFSASVPSGAVRPGYLNSSWSCPDSTGSLELRADSLDDILEGNETNNSFNALWPCDLTPPVITAGPVVSDITETSATLSWFTDDATSTRLSYGWSTHSPQVVEDSALKVGHTLNLTGLTSGMAYFFDLRSTNANGQTLDAARQYFQTKPPGSDPPVVSSVALSKYPHDEYEFYTLSAEVAQPFYTQRVEFYWDGVLLGTDYSKEDGFQLHFSPHAQGWTRSQFFKQHQVTVKAYNQSGAMGQRAEQLAPASAPTPLYLEWLSPASGHEIHYGGSSVPSGTDYTTKIYAYTTPWKCTPSGHASGNPSALPGISCIGMMDKVSQVKLEIFKSGSLKKSAAVVPAGQVVSLSAGLAGQVEGAYQAVVTASTSGATAQASQDFQVVKGAPPLEVLRTVTRQGSYFTIQLGVKNLSSTTVTLDKIQDHLVAFQPAGYGTETSAYVLKQNAYFTSNHLVARPVFDINYSLAPGNIYYLYYDVVPVLYQEQVEPKIGSLAVSVTLSDGREARSFAPADLAIDPLSAEPVPLKAAYINATQSSDYILVTNPWRINHHFGVSDSNNVQKVYGAMARLARLKNGVLGYVQAYDTATLDALLTPTSWWTVMLNPVFRERDKGYVLLVGETEIIPAYYEGTSKFVTFVDIPDWVPYSDLRYADTAGDTARPELVVGRVIGNTPSDWVKTLQRTIDVYIGARSWDGSSAQPVSGRGDYVTSNMIPTIKIVDHVFDDANISSYQLHLYDYPHANREAVMKAHVAEKDVIVMLGHGNPTSWNDSTFSPFNIVNYPWGSTVPAVFALSCKTGNYEDGQDDKSVAEAMINDAAAVYVGATQNTELWSGEWAVKKFVRHWTQNPGISFGQALNRLKRDGFAYDTGAFDHGKMIAFMYNLYGDPKYAVSPDLKSAASAVSARFSALTSVNESELLVSLEPLVIEEVEGEDFVEIPGGSWLFEDGSYLLPMVVVEQDFPEGVWVQNVALAARQGLEASTGLRLPRVTSVPFCEGCTGAPLPPAPEGWTPGLERVFEWRVETRAEGGSRLVLTFFPFQYNADAADALYFRDWSFTIETVETGLALNGLQTSAAVYPLGGVVGIDLRLENSAEAQEVYVNTEIRRQVSGELVGALPLRRLESLSGPASLNLTWDSAETPAGGYYVQVSVMDEQGAVLAAETRAFDLGLTAGEVTLLQLTPPVFSPGATVQIDWQAANQGDLPLGGLAVLEIWEVNAGQPAAVITHTLSALAPGAVLDYRETWQPGGGAGASYVINAYLKYNSQTSDPLAAYLGEAKKLYLPVVRR